MTTVEDATPRNKLDLILYRLDQIERQTKGLVSHERYTLETAPRVERLARLETQFERQKKNNRTLWAGISLALIGPIVSRLGDIIAVFGG